jgi:hypothetical protein
VGSVYAAGIANGGHTRDLRDRFLNGWFRWFFEKNTQFENFAQQNQVNSRKQPSKLRDR